MARRLTALAACAIVILGLAAPVAGAKEGVRARLAAPLPVEAAPGRVVTVAWTLSYADRGRRHPFGAGGIFARVPGHRRAAAREMGPGRYVADVTVPPEGIAALQIGLEGTRTAGGRSEPADMLFAVDAPSRAEAAGGGGPSPGWIAAPLAGLVLVGAALRRRRRAAGG